MGPPGALSWQATLAGNTAAFELYRLSVGWYLVNGLIPFCFQPSGNQG